MEDTILKIIIAIIVVAIYAIPWIATMGIAKDPRTPKSFKKARIVFLVLATILVFWLLILIYLTWPLKF